MRELESIKPVERYLELKALVSEAQEEMKELQPLLMDALVAEPGEKFEHLGCQFSIRRTKVWEYDPGVQGELDALESEIKDLKSHQKELQKAAQQQAQAKVVEYKPALVITQAK